MDHEKAQLPLGTALPEDWIEHAGDGRIDLNEDEPLGHVRDGKVVEGRAGRLFIANDTNRFLEQVTGDLRLARFGLERWKEVLEHRKAQLHELGARYVFMVAPDSHSVFPEELPEGIALVSERPVRQLRNFLDEAGARLPVVYPLEVLLAAKGDRPIYARTDSHWNDYGGLIAYGELLGALGPEVPVRTVGLDDVTFSDVTRAGDLGFKRFPAATSPYATGHLRERAADFLFDNCIRNTGSHVVTECPAAPPTRCVLFGDSFSYPLLRYLSETFARFVFVHSRTIDTDVVRRERPHVVITLMAERFLIEVPYDLVPGSLREAERRKRDADRLRLPLHMWPGAEVLTPPAIELLRAHWRERDGRRDAVIVSVLAYAGLRPGELVRLRWEDVEEHELLVRPVAGREARRVRLLAPLADDLRTWRRECGNPGDDAFVAPGNSGRAWEPGEWELWARYRLAPLAETYSVRAPTPNALRHVFTFLLLGSGMAVEDVAEQMGDSVEHIWGRYQRFVEVIRQLPNELPEREIWRARAVVFKHLQEAISEAEARAGGVAS